MKVDDDIEAIVSSPANSSLEVRKCALDVRLSRRDFKGPVSDGDADMIQTDKLIYELSFLFLKI